MKDVVGEARHADQHDPVAHHAQDEDAEHRPDDGAAPAGQRGSADHHHGDDFELVAGPAVGIGGRGADRADDAGKGRECGAEHEERDLGAVDIDAAGACRAGIPT